MALHKLTIHSSYIPLCNSLFLRWVGVFLSSFRKTVCFEKYKQESHKAPFTLNQKSEGFHCGFVFFLHFLFGFQRSDYNGFDAIAIVTMFPSRIVMAIQQPRYAITICYAHHIYHSFVMPLHILSRALSPIKLHRKPKNESDNFWAQNNDFWFSFYVLNCRNFVASLIWISPLFN